MAQAVMPPGAVGNFSMANVRAFNQDGLHFLRGLRQHGDVAAFLFGPFRAYCANSPAAMHELLVTRADKVNKTPNLKQALLPLLGTGLFTAEGDFWRKQRKLVSPAFHHKRVGAYAESIVGYSADAAAGWRDGATLEITEEMAAVTMRIISKLLFNVSLAEETRVIGHAVTEALKVVNSRIGRLLPPLPEWVPTLENRQYRRAVNQLNALIYRVIAERRASGEDTGDVLSMLLEARQDDGAPMPDEQVRAEAMTLFGAGHETTAVALSWAFYLLSQNPEVEARLHAELDAALGGRLPTLEDMPKLAYAEQIIKETMRLYPPAWAITRVTLEDIELAGYLIPKGRVIVGPIDAIHHDGALWPEPERFNPDRFTPEAEKAIPKYAYLPFGGGPRVCIGNALAMMEATLALSVIAQRFRFSLVPGHVVQPERMFTLRPKYGLKMIAHARA